MGEDWRVNRLFLGNVDKQGGPGGPNLEVRGTVSYLERLVVFKYHGDI